MGMKLTALSRVLCGSENLRAKIHLLGLDATGKTTILYQLKFNTIEAVIPTISFNAEDITVNNVTVSIWDVGRLERRRHIWKYHSPDTEGLLYVVDSTDYMNFEDARDYLFDILKDETTRSGVPIVILANKQDLPQARRTSEIVDALGLQELKSNPWYVQEISAISGDGLHEGVIKMIEMIRTFRNNTM